MQITLTIPEPYAAAIATLAAGQSITPEQWAVRTLRAALRPKETKPLGRPTANAQRDAEIRAKLAAGASYQGLADEYGLSKIRIQQIKAAGSL